MQRIFECKMPLFQGRQLPKGLYTELMGLLTGAYEIRYSPLTGILLGFVNDPVFATERDFLQVWEETRVTFKVKRSVLLVNEHGPGAGDFYAENSNGVEVIRVCRHTQLYGVVWKILSSNVALHNTNQDEFAELLNDKTELVVASGFGTAVLREDQWYCLKLAGMHDPTYAIEFLDAAARVFVAELPRRQAILDIRQYHEFPVLLEMQLGEYADELRQDASIPILAMVVSQPVPSFTIHGNPDEYLRVHGSVYLLANSLKEAEAYMRMPTFQQRGLDSVLAANRKTISPKKN